MFLKWCIYFNGNWEGIGGAWLNLHAIPFPFKKSYNAVIYLISFKCIFICQYASKEDKYEEEIKLLTDKLKEVSDVQSNPVTFKE